MSLVPDVIIASMDFFGFLGFLVALVYGWENYRQTMGIGVTWLSYVMAISFYAAFALMTSLEWFGVLPAILDAAQMPIFSAAVTLTAVFAIVSSVETVKPN